MTNNFFAQAAAAQRVSALYLRWRAGRLRHLRGLLLGQFRRQEEAGRADFVPWRRRTWDRWVAWYAGTAGVLDTEWGLLELP